MSEKLRVVIADDERPARSFLAAALRSFPNVELAGEARNGTEAVRLIERERPDLALLDLQMPELDGIGVVRLIKKTYLPLIAFVTAYDQYAVQAFELNAVDYLLKPVETARLAETLARAEERLTREELRGQISSNLGAAIEQYEHASPTPLERIPVRKRDEILLIPISSVASIVAEGEVLHLCTNRNERYTISYRLRDLEHRIRSDRFIRLSRGTIVNLEMVQRILPLPGGAYIVVLSNNQEFQVSRIQSRVIREQLLKI
jgi:DNA-binding LytR/AlgR family response regulator